MPASIRGNFFPRSTVERGGGSGVFDLFVETFFRPDLIVQYSPAIFKAMVITIELAVCIVSTGLFLGVGLAVLRTCQRRILNLLIVVFSDVNRAVPPLVLVLLAYFGLPGVGVNLPSFIVLWGVLSLVLAAFAEEIFWAGILSIRRGQWEAGRSTGLNFAQTLLFVVFPQALKLAVPPLTNRTIVIIKNTALGSVIGVPEILNVASTAESFVGNITPLTLGAIAYVMLFAPVTAFGRWLETRFSWKRN
jgi:polar amino acid transport system permease protein